MTDQLSLLERPVPTPAPGPPPWAPERFEEPYVTAPLHRAGDPAPSIDAARAALPSAREQNKAITWCLMGMGPVSEDARTGGGTAEQIAWTLNGRSFDGPWDNVIVSRRISGLRLNHIFSYDGDQEKGNPLITREGRSRRPMTVHESLLYRRQKLAQAGSPESRRLVRVA